MQISPLLLIGAGGFARETIELVRAINGETPTWNLIGLLDDNPDLHGQELLGVPIVGSCSYAAERPDARVVACVASPEDPLRRLRLVERLGLPAQRYATLLDPRAAIADSATIGPGSVVHAGSVFTADLRLGSHVAVMPGTILTHDDTIEDGVTFGAGVRVSGAVTIERGAYIGSGALLREKITVGAGALVGMGALVTKSIPAAEVWLGAPARPASPDRVAVLR